MLWMMLATRYYRVISFKERNYTPFRVLFVIGSAAVLVAYGYGFQPLTLSSVDSDLFFPFGSIVYCSALFLVAATLLTGWQLEAIWRSLDIEDKWRYKYLTVGLFWACAVLAWSCSYRMAKEPRKNKITFYPSRLPVIFARSGGGKILRRACYSSGFATPGANKSNPNPGA